jgi:Flp pilus assembly protein TadD
MKFVRKAAALGVLSFAGLAVCVLAEPQSSTVPQTTVRRIPNPDKELQALLTQGQAALDRKDFEAAADAFRKYIAKKPEDAYSHFELGYAYTALGRRSEARDEYARAVALNPTMGPAQLNLGLALLDDNPSAAIDPLRKAAELLPKDARPRFLLGWARERAGNAAAAIEDYQQAEKLDAKNFDIHFSLARTLLSSNRAVEAEAEFRCALELKPDSAPAHLGLGESLISQKKLELASAELVTYLQAKSDDADTRIQHASVLADLGKDDEALAELDRLGAEAAAHSLPALKLRAALLLRQNKFSQSAAALRGALALAPQDAGLHSRLGHALLGEKDYAGAAREFAEALRINPADSGALRDGVSAMYLSGNYSGALKGLDLLEQREKPTDSIWFLRAESYDKLGDKPEALQAYEKFLSLHVGINDDRYFAATARVRALSREVRKK